MTLDEVGLEAEQNATKPLRMRYLYDAVIKVDKAFKKKAGLHQCRHNALEEDNLGLNKLPWRPQSNLAVGKEVVEAKS
ncbi:hypothetical protein FNV43_RR21290 [Rhamnella rubrinervis]|uniref:Uncharacterized protein n=1 Tax=Rhamnella rubrinervis TaxID=2594499 RepID=A0A8K0E206_9ROSA|nr:hypothetical protein FNV43_RR21290 [Rhamnella rubrinervis]